LSQPRIFDTERADGITNDGESQDAGHGEWIDADGNPTPAIEQPLGVGERGMEPSTPSRPGADPLAGLKSVAELSGELGAAALAGERVR
jgi:hypothetical protein